MSLPLDRAPLTPSLSSPLASNHQTRTARLCTSIAVVVLAFLGLMVPMAQAQPAQFTQNSLSSNAMTLEVPLANYPGRGGSMPVSLHYSSKVWRIGFMKSVLAAPSLRRRWVPNRRGGGQYRYVGPRTWREGLHYVGGTWRTGSGGPVPGIEYNKHHIFPQQFRQQFKQAGVEIDRVTLLMPAEFHRRLHPQWNQEWATFFANNPRPSSRDIYRQGVDMMFRYNIHLYPVVPFR